MNDVQDPFGDKVPFHPNNLVRKERKSSRSPINPIDLDNFKTGTTKSKDRLDVCSSHNGASPRTRRRNSTSLTTASQSHKESKRSINNSAQVRKTSRPTSNRKSISKVENHEESRRTATEMSSFQKERQKSSSGSEKEPNDPWGSHSPNRRIKKFEEHHKVQQTDETKILNVKENIVEVSSSENHLTESDEEVLNTKAIEKKVEHDNDHLKCSIPIPMNISKEIEMKLVPSSCENLTEHQNTPQSECKAVTNKQTLPNESLSILISTSVQCNLDKKTHSESGGGGDAEWKFVPNPAIQEKIFLGYFRRQNSSEHIKVFFDTDKKATKTKVEEPLGWCSSYILMRIFFISLLTVGLTLLMMSSLS